jgi:transcriptional regulator with XRE-family HTH domain
MELADKLLQLRKTKGWTQANAAKIIDIQQSYLSKLENGHYVPSTEVVTKLCVAYHINADELLPSPKKQGRAVTLASCLLFIAFGLLLAGYLSLFFPQTYYTYKTTPMQPLKPEQLSLNFHLTDQYLGEQYLRKISAIEYKFELIAQREVSRKENRWLIALGYLLMVFSLGYLLLVLKERWLNTEPTSSS